MRSLWTWSRLLLALGRWRGENWRREDSGSLLSSQHAAKRLLPCEFFLLEVSVGVVFGREGGGLCTVTANTRISGNCLRYANYTCYVGLKYCC